MNRLYYTKNYIFIIIALFATIGTRLHAQLQIDSTLTPAQLVQNVLLGNGITATNITYTGFPNSISKFTAVGNLGIPSGIMLTTGYAGVAYGPNSPLSGSAGSDVGPQSNFNTGPNADGDPDLDAIIPQIISPVYSNDAAVLEFDFVPISDSLKFRYVFASEEYPEFVGSINDVFAFFLTGPGGYNNTNIALIPGTSIPITIGNINNIDNSQYYVDNTNGTTVEYDGFTTVMTASAAVQCGLTYHIKIAIGDASDGVWDSAVFLEAGSFSSAGNTQIIPIVTYSANDTVMYEGCTGAALAIIRAGNNSQAVTYSYTMSGSATNGVDLTMLSGQVTIPAGQDTGFIVLDPINDGVTEGTETFTLVVSNSVCDSTNTTTITVYFNDPIPVTANAGPDQTTACSVGSSINLSAMGGGGLAPYTYQWNPTGGTTQSIAVLPATTTTYTVTVTDVCGNTATDDVEVAVEAPTPLTLTLTADTTICQNGIATLIATPVGGNGTITTTWNTGDQSNTIQVSPMATSAYTVTVTDACNQTVTENVTVTVVPNNADFDYFFTSNNAVTFDNQSIGYENLVLWNFGDSTTSAVFEPSHVYASPGTYIVTLIVENSEGCRDTMQQSLLVRPNFYFYIPNSFSPNGDGINEAFNGKGEGFEVYNMSIYNRWGQRIFKTNSLNNGWLGLDANDNPVPIDTYIYVVSLRITPEKDEIIYRGKVSVIR